MCRGIELDPKFVDVIVKRYIEHSEGHYDDVYVIRDSQKLKFEEVATFEPEGRSLMENKQLTLGSLFDGLRGFSIGRAFDGQITPVWSSEIEPFAIRVTTKRLPQVKHYGDVSTISGADLPPVDIITFGSPCQDMSIAGKRDGLDGSRSSLFYEAIRIVKEMRCKTNGEKPRFIVWENVPGAFSSNQGQDFKAVLEAVIGVKEPSASVPAPEKKGWPDADYYVGDGWSVAYRVFDAQWWGVPQRRKRIYLVADFADQSAQKVLFESEACLGILRRASVRGKELPPVLKAALERQAAVEQEDGSV